MPLAVSRNPFPDREKPTSTLLTPQARVLAALMPDDASEPNFLWRVINRAQLGVRAGYSPISGTITRALNGIRPNNTSSGTPHLGLIGLGLVEVVKLDICDIEEINYRATPAGVEAYRAYVAVHGELPIVKDAGTCSNTSRGYKRGEWIQGADRYRGKIEAPKSI